MDELTATLYRAEIEVDCCNLIKLQSIKNPSGSCQLYFIILFIINNFELHIPASNMLLSLFAKPHKMQCKYSCCSNLDE